MKKTTSTLTALLLLTAVGCFEEPYREHLHLWLLPGGQVVLTVVQEVDEPGEVPDNRALEERLQEARSAMERGWDRWSQRLATIRPKADLWTLERVGGVVTRLSQSALVQGSDDDGQRFLAECGFSALFDPGEEGVEELALYATGTGLATQRQRELLNRRLEGWGDAVFDYLTAAGDLYAYLEEAPDRATGCFAHVFDQGAEDEPLEPGEEQLVNRLDRSIEKVASALIIGPDEAMSLNQLSRLVFDPFPARLTISLSGSPLEIEGLVEREGFLERPPVSLWASLGSLEGRWLRPDIVTAMAAPGGLGEQPESEPAAFAAIPRWFEKPSSPAEVVEALRQGLVPEEMCRVRWRTMEPPTQDPLELLRAAEAALPAAAGR